MHISNSKNSILKLHDQTGQQEEHHVMQNVPKARWLAVAIGGRQMRTKVTQLVRQHEGVRVEDDDRDHESVEGDKPLVHL